MSFECIYGNWGIPVAMLAYMQMTYGISSAHAQWFSYRKSRADDHDIIR